MTVKLGGLLKEETVCQTVKDLYLDQRQNPSMTFGFIWSCSFTSTCKEMAELFLKSDNKKENMFLYVEKANAGRSGGRERERESKTERNNFLFPSGLT